MKRRSGWLWGGRVVAAVAIALLAAYLWHVGLSKAAPLAEVLSLLVAVAALVAPYLLPPDSPEVHSPPARPELPDTIRQSVTAPIPDLLSPMTAHAPPVPAKALPPKISPAGESQTAPDKSAWIAAVMAFSDMEDPDFRRAVLRNMGDKLNLGRAFLVPYRPMARDHVVEIIDRCWDFKDPDEARHALTEALVSLRPDSRAADSLKRMVANSV